MSSRTQTIEARRLLDQTGGEDVLDRLMNDLENTTDPVLKRTMMEAAERMRLNPGDAKNFLRRTWEKMCRFGNAAVGLFLGFCRSMKTLGEIVWEAVKEAFNEIVDAFRAIWQSFVQWLMTTFPVIAILTWLPK